MTATHRKILSDLLQEGVRTALVVSAIAAGIAGYGIRPRELNVRCRDTSPATAHLRIDELAAEGRTVVVATHDRNLSGLVDRTLELADGALLRQQVAR